jgi:hypothetical protein
LEDQLTAVTAGLTNYHSVFKKVLFISFNCLILCKCW